MTFQVGAWTNVFTGSSCQDGSKKGMGSLSWSHASPDEVALLLHRLHALRRGRKIL